MSDVIEIDLRKLISVLLLKRFWITGFSFLVGLTVFLYFFLQPKMFEATAVITLTEPRSLLNFDSHYETVKTSPLSNKVAMDIAESQELAVYVFDAWSDPQKKPDQWYDFAKNNLIVNAGSDPKVVTLTVRLTSGEEAARLANLWAQRVVDRINVLYAGQDQDQLAFFESQVQDASTNLEKAQNALLEFEGRNAEKALSAELDALLQQQKDYLLRDQLIASLKRDANALLQEVDGLPGTASLPGELQIRLLTLQLNQYLDLSQSGGASPFQYQLPLVNDSQPVNVADFRSSIQGWLTSLDEQSAEINDLLKAYPQNLSSLQQQIEMLIEEKDQLTLELGIASDTYSILNRKYQETSISSKDSNNVGSAKIAAQAFSYTSSGSGKAKVYSLIGFVGAAVLAATFVLFQDWWRRSDNRSEPS
ncbi:MAG: Wzz/FepE/Etk N-terminal domain-containing protein [Bellilinea sp.]